MRFWLGLLLVVGVCYQLFFRYERWPSDEDNGRFYERDNLTGKVQLLKQGEKTRNWLARFFQDDNPVLQSSDSVETDHMMDSDSSKTNAPLKPTEKAESPEVQAFNDTLQSDGEKIVSKDMNQNKPPVPGPKRTIISMKNEPPVPMAMLATADIDDPNNQEDKPFAVRQVDLNHDGSAEEIIQNSTHDGLLDISIVKNGQEIFYGRGKQIKLLSSHNDQGWEDIGIKTSQGALQTYRYSLKDAAYITLKR